MRLASPLGDARGWRGKALDAGWRHVLAPEVLAALVAGEDCAEALQRVALTLEEGPGFAVIAGLDNARLGREAAQAA